MRIQPRPFLEAIVQRKMPENAKPAVESSIHKNNGPRIYFFPFPDFIAVHADLSDWRGVLVLVQ
jgi:hypothetical protein